MSNLMRPMSRPAYTYDDNALWSQTSWDTFTTHYWHFRLCQYADYTGITCTM